MTIRLSAMQMLNTLLSPLGYPIAWQGVNFTPTTDYWLEVRMFSGEGDQPGTANDSQYIPDGLLQISAIGRAGLGMIGVDNVAQEVIDALPAGTPIVGNVRIRRTPYRSLESEEEDRLIVDVIAPYGV